MKKYICILLFGLFSAVMFGQPTYQHRMDTAIDIGTHDSPFTFTDSRYTGDFGDDFYWDVDYPPYLGVKEIFYRITLTNSMTVRFNVTRPDRCWTNVILLDDAGKRWEYNSRVYKAFGLIPGVYYFVVEGQQSGNLNDPVPDVTIEVQIEGSERTMGEDFLCPFELGSFSDNFNLTPGVDNFDQFRNDYRSAKDMRVDEYTHDVVYRFTLENPMKVSLRQRGVRDEYDYSQSSLMNAAGDTICVSNSGDSNARQLELSAGDYYIYGWGRSFRSSGFSFDLSGTLPPVGSDFFYPVEVGSRFSDFTYTDTRSTSNFSSSKQPEKAGKEVYYRFTITQPMGIGINTCGSAVADTYLKVFSSDRQRVLYFNDDYSGSGACSNTKSACIHIPLLMPGTYYVVTDGAGNGSLTTSLTGTVVDNPGDSSEMAIDLGPHSKGFSFSDIRNTASGYTNRYQGKTTNDVYYKFTMEKALAVTIDHEGSSLSDTYMSLLDKDGKLLRNSDNTKGHAQLELQELAVGTYYVVSEGISLNGSITTNIRIRGAGGDIVTTKGQPHVISLTPLKKTSSTSSLKEDEQLLEIQYFDHLGEPTERIQRSITPGGNNLITIQEYDGIGRELREWLPAPGGDDFGAYVHPSVVKRAAQSTELYGNDGRPYSETSYDGSELGRVVRQAGAGNDWHTADKAVTTDYVTNAGDVAQLSVRMYGYSGDALKSTGYYADGSLYGVRATDEDGNVSYEFKDKLGRVVLTRQMDGSLAHDTYYVYDEYGNVRFVLPPLAADNLNSAASWTESNEILKNYVYVYRYDRLNRCIYKKLPGCEPVYTVYDAADRPIFTQDGEQRTKGEWAFSIPDAFNRVVLTGICKNNPDYMADPLKGIVVKAVWVDSASSVKGYSISGITLNTPTVLSAVYYDSYGFMGKSNSIPNDATTAYAEVPGYGKRYPGGCRGQQTGSYIAKLSKTGTVTGYVYQVMYYDERYRIVQQRGNNELGGTDLTCTAYSFTGKPTQVKQVHSVPGKETVTEVRQHTYDHADRLLRTSYQLNTDAPVTLVDHVYDELGRLKSDRRNGNGKLRSDYAYNVRSWMKSVSGPLFSQTLNYQEPMTGTIPCYNGNISSMSWKAGSETTDRGYRFTYDGLSRLKDATYGEGNDLTTNPNRFNEQITGYDKMGNILKLKRYGQISSAAYGLVDDLSLTYNGNQLLAVKDIATSGVYGNGTDFKDGANQPTEYAYDKNGNLIKDLNKNISSIGYNCLNLPDQVIFGNGNSILYDYGADGTKLRTVHTTGSSALTTDYCGNAVYENGVLKMLLNEAGYVSFPDRKFHFYLKDRQGNIRVVADKDGTVEETNSYYPFGGMFTSANSVQPYKYNGKELDRKNGLNCYDYGARQYDAVLGRWTTVDPMSETCYKYSPFIYCNNCPVKYIDPDGNSTQIPPFVFGGANPILTTGSRITMLGTTDKVLRLLPKE